VDDRLNSTDIRSCCNPVRKLFLFNPQKVQHELLGKGSTVEIPDISMALIRKLRAWVSQHINLKLTLEIAER